MKTMEITETERQLILRIAELESQVRDQDKHIEELQAKIRAWQLVLESLMRT